jgi:hypothetical protein
MDAVHTAHPGVRIVVGGRYQDLVPEPAERLGHSIADAAARLAQVLSAGA